MKKENFVSLINGLIDLSAKEDGLCKALNPYFDGYLIPMMTNEITDAIITMLEDEMGDENDIISWWLYDAPNAGKDHDSCYVYIDDTEKVLVDTPEKLYDHLLDCSNG